MSSAARSLEERLSRWFRPELEFPKAQSMKRRFILHIGPTNSGKTYQALERLKLAQNGVYLGPLRLLALEVYEKMNDAGIPCTMLTGQECLEVSDIPGPGQFLVHLQERFIYA